MSNSKIVELNNWDAEKHGKIVLCHGHFNVIHPGHIRYLKHAKELGETLVVSILGHCGLVSLSCIFLFRVDGLCPVVRAQVARMGSGSRRFP